MTDERARRAPAAGSIRRVAVLALGEKPQVREFLEELRPWLAGRVDEVEVHEDVRNFRREDLGGRPDLVVVLGGDGALLTAAEAFAAEPVPTLGINFGRVGFLAACAAGHWRVALVGILEGHGVPDPRMRLEATLPGGETRILLNEAVVSGGVRGGMISVSLTVGTDWVTDYRADGLIVATPSGSTAYSLASGGPILAPHVEAIVVTPVASQGLSNRPIVLHPDSELALVPSGDAVCALDGRGFHPVAEGECVRLRRHPVSYPLLSMPGLDPYRRLRSRLGWSGSVRPEQET